MIIPATSNAEIFNSKLSKSILDCDFERCLGLTLGREVEQFVIWVLPLSQLIFTYLNTMLTSSFALAKAVDFLERSQLSVF
jgi:hypothetical protein